MTDNNESEENSELNAPRTVSLYFQAIVLIVIGILFISFLYFGDVIDKCMIESLADVKIARGLITFLFAGGTILISLIVCVGALLGRGDAAEKSFYRAKEILTILVGILGTIVGFYFGSEAEGKKHILTIAEPILSVQDVVKSEELFKFTSFVSGGKKPYQYKISFPDFKEIVIKGFADENGWIQKEVKAPKVQNKRTLSYQLEVQDASGIKKQFIVEGDKGLEVAP